MWPGTHGKLKGICCQRVHGWQDDAVRLRDIKWTFQKCLFFMKLILKVGIIWRLEDSSNKIGMLLPWHNCIIKNWSYKSVFNWCYPPNLFAYYLISERNVGDPVWVPLGQLPQYLTQATNLLEEITNTRKLFCPTHPAPSALRSEWRWQNHELIWLRSIVNASCVTIWTFRQNSKVKVRVVKWQEPNPFKRAF